MNAIFETRRVKIAETSNHYATVKISSSYDACDFVKNHLGDHFDSCDVEELHVICLNTKNVVTSVTRLTRGGLDSAIAEPRGLFRAALLDNASSVILTHNHPSGDSTPSRADISVTDRMTEVGKIVGIGVLDHIVYGSQDCVTSISSL